MSLAKFPTNFPVKRRKKVVITKLQETHLFFSYVQTHCPCKVYVILLGWKKNPVAHSQHALRLRQRHTASVWWARLWCDVGRECVKNTDALIHGPMAVCLVTHNTGIAQSAPDPFLCDTTEVNFLHFLCIEGERNTRKSSIFLSTLAEVDTLKLTLSYLKWNTSEWVCSCFHIFSTVVLGCLVNTGGWCCWYFHSETKKWGFFSWKF